MKDIDKLPHWPRGLSRTLAASYVGVSPTTFDRMIKDGLMPRPKAVYGRRLWDVRAVDIAFDLLDGGHRRDDAGQVIYELSNEPSLEIRQEKKRKIPNIQSFRRKRRKRGLLGMMLRNELIYWRNRWDLWRGKLSAACFIAVVYLSSAVKSLKGVPPPRWKSWSGEVSWSTMHPSPKGRERDTKLLQPVMPPLSNSKPSRPSSPSTTLASCASDGCPAPMLSANLANGGVNNGQSDGASALPQ